MAQDVLHRIYTRIVSPRAAISRFVGGETAGELFKLRNNCTEQSYKSLAAVVLSLVSCFE